MAEIEIRWATASFEEKYKAMMASMSEEDQKRSAEQVAYTCKCRTCPTYTEWRNQSCLLQSRKKRYNPIA
jgi:hypothetical protein